MPPARKPPPGNPLWITWLKEWEKEMAEKSEHMPKVIRKAIKSFEQCPVPIDHPANAGTLRNVGDKTMKYLTTRLKAYCEANGLDMPLATYTNFEKEAAKINKKKRKSGIDGNAEDEEGAVAGGSGAGTAGSDSDAEVNTSPVKKPRKARVYAPRVKSGPWAILIGLASYGAEAWKTQEQIIERADPFFGEEGQSLKDKATAGGAGAQFYTGWSSSKTLFTKGYLEKKSRNPVLYQITYAGWKIARKAVRNAKRNNDIDVDARRVLPDFETEDEASDEDPSDAENRPATAATAAARGRSDVAGQSKGKGRATATTAPAAMPRTIEIPSQSLPRRVSDSSMLSPNDPAAPFLFYYLTEDNQRVPRQMQAEMTMCQNTYTALFRIEFRQSQAKHIYAQRNVVGEHVPVLRDGPLGPEGPTFSAFLTPKHALDPCPTFNMLKPSSKPPAAMTSHNPQHSSLAQATSHTSFAEKPRAAQRATTAGPSAPSTSYSSTSTITTTTTSAPASTSTLNRTSQAHSPPKARASSSDIVEIEEIPPTTFREKMLRAAEARSGHASSSSPAKVDLKGKGKAMLPNAFDILQAAAASSAKAASTPALPAIQMTVTVDGDFIPDVDAIECATWAPKSYDVQLIIDTREKPGLKSDRIEKMLTEKGIKWNAATLAMGDAIWVARHKTTGEEVVLDACLERKRLDDLLSSMRDGRYTEQKNRMVTSGISKLIYLVEEHDSKKAMETWGRQIWTMKSSLQIIEDFTVHIAWDVAEACNYLARLTKTFVEFYQDITLTVLPDACLDKSYHVPFMNYLRAEHPTASYVYSMVSFKTMNCKQHSVHTGWAKSVASINQMSLASTERFLQKWPTPAIFFEQLEDTVSNDREAQMKLAEEEALDPHANKRKKKDDPKIGERWIMRETSTQADNGEIMRPIGQALSTHCWRLFTADKY